MDTDLIIIQQVKFIKDICKGGKNIKYLGKASNLEIEEYLKQEPRPLRGCELSIAYFKFSIDGMLMILRHRIQPDNVI